MDSESGFEKADTNNANFKAAEVSLRGMQPAAVPGIQAAPHGHLDSTGMTPSHVAVQTEGLVRKFGERKALAGVTFALDEGDTLSVFGPNGAGKTTLLRVLAGILRPTSGTARIGGISLPGGAAARARAGLITHASMLYGALSALENVEFTARMYGVSGARAASLAALKKIGADHHGSAPVRFLSRGQQQRVSIARALVHSPSVLLLDEPFSGLDAQGSQNLTALLAELRGSGAAMIVVTHNIIEGLSLATHCAIMLHGAFARLEPRGQVDPASYAALYHELATRNA